LFFLVALRLVYGYVMGAGNDAGKHERCPPMNETEREQTIQRAKAVRPARWAWRIDGLEMSRKDVIELWHKKLESERIGSIWNLFIYPAPTGFSCHTKENLNGTKGHKILTLRELLEKSRKDYNYRADYVGNTGK
jgi:hypothetical protein